MRIAKALVSWTIVVISAALLVAACGGDDSENEDTAAAKGQSDAVAPLTVAHANTLISVFPFYIGLAKGFFKEEGVDVKLVTRLGNNVPNYVTSGQADIGLYGFTVPVTMAKQGQDTKIILGILPSSTYSFVSEEYKTLDELRNLDKCTIVTNPPGSSVYTNLKAAVDYLDLGNCEISTVPDIPSQLGALTSGRADAAYGNNDGWKSGLDAGRLHLMFYPTLRPEDKAMIPEDATVASSGDFGIASNLAEKRESVVRYIRGYLKALEYSRTAPDAELAKILKDTQPDLATQSLESLTEAIKDAKPNLATGGIDDGHISEDQWNNTLRFNQLGDVPNFPAADDPVASYQDRVDMSYYDEATSGK